tara:strand:- start:742 stop:2136 length:1395 start_codon:yes stop_codon:yes gene_type:complete
MGLTISSILIIPYGIFCFFRNSDLLIKSAIFFVPFSATSVINLGSGVPITAFQYLALILIFKEILLICFKGKFSWPSETIQAYSLKLCFFFLLLCLFSLITPALINGEYNIYSTDFSKGYPLVKLSFSLSSLNKLFPLFVGIFLIFVLLQNSTSVKSLRSYLKVYIVSICFISSWGLFQYVLWILGIEYPNFIFNTMISELRVADSEISSESGIIRRIYSVTQEPSHFVCFLLSGLPILYVNNFYGEPIINRFFGTLFIFIIIFTLLISFTTTGVGGLAIFSFITYLTLFAKNPLSLIFRSLFFLMIMILLIIALSQFEVVSDFLNLIFIEKLISGSMIERIFFIEKAWLHFIDYPFLGLGMGNITSSDLIVFLLSNVGIIGFLLFFYLISKLIKGAIMNKKILLKNTDYSNRNSNLALIDGVLIAFYVQLLVYALMGFVWYLPVFYLMIFFIISVSSKNLSNN